MYIDASAIVAILNDEPDAALYKSAIDRSMVSGVVSPATIFEATVSLARAKTLPLGRRPTAEEVRRAHQAVRAFLSVNRISEVELSSEIGRRAIEAAAEFGKAVGHPADLNFGDCFAYAYAKSRDMTLLFKGDDFRKTDIASALA